MNGEQCAMCVSSFGLDWMKMAGDFRMGEGIGMGAKRKDGRGMRGRERKKRKKMKGSGSHAI